MRIERLKISGFRQYRSIELDLSDERSDMVILVGKNGTGKTNLLNALIWCLYGQEEYYSKQMESSPLVNQGALDDASEGDLVICEVTVDLRFADGVEARICRRGEFTKSGKWAKSLGKPELSVSVLEDVSKGMRTVGNPQHWIERWVPSRLEPYFLFDGERLDEFFKDAEAKQIENAVLQIAQIDLLGRLVKHLETVSSELYSRAAKESGGVEMGVLSQQLDVAREALAGAEASLSEKESALQEHDDAVRRFEAKFGDIREVHGEIQKRKSKESELANINSELQAAWKSLYEWSCSISPAAFAGEALSGLATAVDDARTERRLPPPVDPEILRRLLDQESCVCGSALGKGSEGRAAIEGLLDEYTRVGIIGEELLTVETDTRDLLGTLRAGGDTADAIMKRIGDWEHRYQTVYEEIEYLNARLAKHEDANVALIQSQLEKAKQARALEQRDVARLELQCEDFRRRIKDAERQMELLAAKDERAEKLMLEARFAKHCLREAVSLYGHLTNEVRSRVASTLEKHFLAMIWKRESIGAVTIDEAYRVSVKNNRGFELLPVLSAGERECLALAFSIALSEVSGYELPMVIDTPMGRLSADVQEQMGEVLSRATARAEGEPAHQLIMLMTEVEYSDRVAKVLSVRNPRVFDIEFDQAATASSLREVS